MNLASQIQLKKNYKKKVFSKHSKNIDKSTNVLHCAASKIIHNYTSSVH